ncbi:MAG: hypothetical protein GEU77_06600, partial [Deltaproteobacteria bacterium]|nr:hypothetical protein [Deltaproteobacteria bacterium]
MGSSRPFEPIDGSRNLKRRHPDSVSDKIARFVSKVRPRDIPPTVREAAKEHLLDGFATMAGGAAEEASRHIDRYLHNLGSKAEATVIGADTKLTAQHAALANGIRGH